MRSLPPSCSAEMLARAPGPHHQADATALPFPDASFGSVARLYVFHHPPDRSAEQFAEVEVERWDARLLELPTRAAVRDYLLGKGVERGVAGAKAETIAIRLLITKRGALAFGRKA